MSKSLCAALFGCALAMGGGTLASAQPSPSPSPTSLATTAPKPVPAATASASAAPSPTATPYKLITFSGAADAGYEHASNSDQTRFVNGAPSRIFDGAQGPFFDANGGRQLAPGQDTINSLDLQNINIVTKINGPVVSGLVETSFGTDANVIASNGQSRSGFNITQAFAQYANGPFTLIAGKFTTLAGAEVIEQSSSSNFNYSRSYLFGEAIPFTHTGVRATFVATPKLTFNVGANNGWDDWKFDGKKKTLEGNVTLTASPAVTLLLTTYNGNDFVASGNSVLGIPPMYSNRMLYDGVLSLQATSALKAVVNYDHGTQLGAITDPFTGLTHAAQWDGVAGYVTYQFTPLYGLALRTETFRDNGGFRTGLDQRLQSNTATINYTPNSNLLFRGEYRIDASDMPVFEFRNRGGGPGAPHQETFGFETIVKFP